MQRKKALKWAAGIAITPIALFVILAALLYIPAIQDMVVKQVTEYASQQTGMEISVKRVRLVFPLDLGVEGFRMTQPNDSSANKKDTIADVGRLVADVRLWPLIRQQVEVDALELNDAKVNTANIIKEARVKGEIGRLYLKSRGIDLGKETVRVNSAVLADANVSVELSDTVPPDTTTSKTNWKITLDKLDISKTGLTLHTPGDTMRIGAYIGKAEARKGYFDLYSGLYRLNSLSLKEGKVTYDNTFEDTTDGLDPNHIAISDVTIGIDSIYFRTPDMRLALRECAFKEKSGITVEKLTGAVTMDSTAINLPGLILKTPDSHIAAQLAMATNAFEESNPGTLSLNVDGTIGKQDIMHFLGKMPTGFVRRWPNRPLTVKAVAAGTMKNMSFGGINIKLPTAFNINAGGTAGNLTDTEKMNAAVKITANTYDLGFINELLKAQGVSAVIPRNISMNGKVGINGKRYEADLTMREDSGKVVAQGYFDAGRMAYDANVAIEGLQIAHFMPDGGMGALTASMAVNGRGIKPTSPRTRLTASAQVDDFSMSGYDLDGITLDAELKDGKGRVELNSENPLAQGKVGLYALMNTDTVRSTLVADVRHIDLYSLRLVESEFTSSLRCRVDVGSDLKNMLYVRGKLNDLILRDSGRVFTPDDLQVDILTSRDTTRFVTECGDFRLHFNGKGGYRKILEAAMQFKDEMTTELQNKQISVSELRKRLPLAQLYLATGKENPLSRFIAREGFTFQDATIDISSSPVLGLNGSVKLLKLQNSAVTLDTVRFNIVSDSTSCKYNGQVRNNKKNKQYVFNALLDGYIFEKGSGANIKFYDSADSLGLQLGLEASMEDDGIKVHVLTDKTVLGYKPFKVNEDNFIQMRTDRRVYAKLRMMADDGTGIHIYSNDDNTEALQDITVGLNRLDLEKALSVLPYMPDITGIMNGDVHMIQTTEAMTVSAAVSVDKMTYERSRMGNISTEFVYMPYGENTHGVDGVLSCNDVQVAELSGIYNAEGEGNLDVNLNMERMPVRLINGFIPDRIIRLSGYADGQLAINGTLDKLRANGEVKFDSCHMRSMQYGVRMRFSEEPLRIVGSNLLFEDFKMYANNNNALTVNGNVDFSNPSDMNMDLRMMAQNYQIIDAKENRRSIVFGKAFVDFFATIKGPMELMSMTGRLNVLGSTDMSYILRDTPLSTDNRMEELVKFVSFEDTTETVVEHEPISGFKMDLTLNIDQGAHIICYLNTDHSNYIDLMGGGSLRMQYGADGDIRLTGRYTLDNGEMKYSLPVIPLKTFSIQDGSYIEFTGDPMNPRLNITATERTKANVTSEGSDQGRTVEFDCGVVITKTLADMGLEFTISAPEDMTLNSELQSMSVEQRGKIAVTMLTTGMYIADGNTSGFSMNDALSSFLQSEINNITGSALRTLDLSFGMDNSTDASGSTHTDYSFKFSKRFWNNRLRIVIGGKVSTGSEMTNQNESFFDNVTFEYRLGKSSDKYVKLYYDNNAYDWLEGTVREYGVGFIWRRSMQNFKDIFSLKKKSMVPADSVRRPKETADDGNEN